MGLEIKKIVVSHNFFRAVIARELIALGLTYLIKESRNGCCIQVDSEGVVSRAPKNEENS